jgi:hypothetical protein
MISRLRRGEPPIKVRVVEAATDAVSGALAYAVTVLSYVDQRPLAAKFFDFAWIQAILRYIGRPYQGFLSRKHNAIR